MTVTARSLGVLTVCFLAVFVSHSDATSGLARCPGYCDRYGRYHRPEVCHPINTNQAYCCGNLHFRYCCPNASREIDLPGTDWCVSHWWSTQWRVMLGMLLSLFVMLAIVGCCYYCCGSDGSHWCDRRSRANRNRTADSTAGMPTVSYAADREEQRRTSIFDATRPYAFEPPSYESLPKDPPKYSEIYEGNTNPAYNAEGDQTSPAPTASSNTNPVPPAASARIVRENPSVSEAPPPPYTLQANSQSPSADTQTTTPAGDQPVSTVSNSSSAEVSRSSGNQSTERSPGNDQSIGTNGSTNGSTAEQTQSSVATNDVPVSPLPRDQAPPCGETNENRASSVPREQAPPVPANETTSANNSAIATETPSSSPSQDTATSNNNMVNNKPVVPKSKEPATGSVRTHGVADTPAKEASTKVETH